LPQGHDEGPAPPAATPSARPDPTRPTDKPFEALTAGLEASVAAEMDAQITRAFGRYVNLGFVGAGGMANVYRAEDPVLGRTVALKLIRGADPAMADRLLAEAKAQARIEHENVCHIYEAGMLEGRAYIVMQYVDGNTLQALADTLGLEQKLQLMKQVAEGVHAAHRAGLIHRDLKPSNIMVESTAEGERVPYVLDFGLAREVAAPGVTMNGVVLGTPWYMSPEQARGDSRLLDRRTDVYALGATLYDLITGHPPYDGDSSVSVLVRVLSEDPVPLAERAPGIPADVRTITMKCMERDPARRYESARALADDLGRYLDGEPIAARATSLLNRLAHRARKNKTAVVASTLALLVALVSGALGLRAWLSARSQAALAAEFAQGLQDVYWFMRAAYLAPAHDVSRERAVVRERLRAMEARMNAVGSLARGPGEYALGRGQLLLGKPDEARVHLERAWASGFRTSETAYALGETLGLIYRRERNLADGIAVKAAREKRKAEIQSTLRDPAVSYLRQGTVSGVAPPEYVEALVAYYERRYPDALGQAEASLRRAPWHYEALMLQGEVQTTLARERHETGDAFGSRLALERMERAYRAASEYARSDPSARTGLCQVAVQRMEWVVYTGADISTLYEQAVKTCSETLQVDSGAAEPHGRLANIHRFRANSLMTQGQDPLPALALAVAEAERALAIEPDSRGAHGNRGVAFRLRAQWEKNHGLDPTYALAEALKSLGRSTELRPDAGAFNDLGNAYVTRAELTVAKGGDPTADITEALARYGRSLSLVPDFGYAHANRGLALTALGEYELGHGRDATASLGEAEKSLQRSVDLLPDLEGTHTRLATALLLAARQGTSRGSDPAALLARARAELAEARRVNPKPGPETLEVNGTAALEEARWLVERGGSGAASAGPLLQAALEQLQAAVAGDPKAAAALRKLGEAALLQARFRLAAGQDPGASFAAAESAYLKVAALNEKDPRGWAGLAELYQRRAAWVRARGRDAGADLASGRTAAARALDADPTLAQALRAREGLGG
jgi:eukaryotic-like serine/threonine-protein kinase